MFILSLFSLTFSQERINGLPIAGDAIIGIFYKQALKFAILLCSWLNFGWLLPGGYVYVHLFL